MHAELRQAYEKEMHAAAEHYSGGNPNKAFYHLERAFSYPWLSSDFDTEKTSTMLRPILNWRGTQNLGLIHEPTLALP